MISSRILQNAVVSELNMLNTNGLKSVDAIEIDDSLNKAKDYIIHNYSIIAEKNKELEEHLRELEVVDYAITPNDLAENGTYSTCTLPVDYYTYLSVYAIGVKTIQNTVCEDTIWNNTYFSSNHISLNDPNRQPSWEWRSGLYNLKGDKLLYYHNKQYQVKRVFLNYIKELPDVATPSLTKDKFYESADGKIINEDKPLLISSTVLWRKICEMAAADLSRKTGNYQQYQALMNSILFNETTAIQK